MDSKNEFKKKFIKNNACYYFDYTIGIFDINFRNILLDEVKSENILIYTISYKTAFMGSIPLFIRFDEIDGFIKIYDGIRYLVLLSYLYDEICNRIKYNFAKIRIDLYNSLPIEKMLTFHNVIIIIKSFVNEDKNKYYHNIFLEKGSYKDKSDTQYLK